MGNADSIWFGETGVTYKKLMTILGRSLSLMQDGVVTQNRELLAQGAKTHLKWPRRSVFNEKNFCGLAQKI
jgi:hypothetical protein